MLSLPHLVVLFVLALMVFGPQKLPELARMLGKATAEFRKMTSDFRYALEDEVRELERQTRIREEEATAAARVTPAPVPAPSTSSPPEGAVPRETPVESVSAPLAPLNAADLPPHADSVSSQEPLPESPRTPHEKSSDDAAV